MMVQDFPPRPSSEPKSGDFLEWLDILGLRQNIDLLNELTSVASGDELYIFDVSTGLTKKVTVANLVGGLTGPLTNSLGADVNLNNTGTYFTGPTVAQGTSGVWFVSGSVVVQDGTAGANLINAKLWDGTTVVASARGVCDGSGASQITLAMSGYISSPAGNLRISVNDATTTAGLIKFNASGNSKDSTITAIRIG